MLFRKFEAVETAEGTKYLLDGEEIRHVVGCSLELLSAERSRYLLTLKVAVSNCTYRVKDGTEEEDTSYHQLRVKMEGFCADSVQLDDRDMLPGLVGFGMKLHCGGHGTVATLLTHVTTDKETAKRYERDENNDLLH